MVYIVQVSTVPGSLHYLWGTAWTSEESRAARFTTVAEAQAAIAKAAKFNPRAAKMARVSEREA